MSNAAARSAPRGVGDPRRGVGRDLVRAHGRDDHEVQIACVGARVLQRAARGEDRHVVGALVGRGAAAGLDPGPLDDPVVVDADALGDVAVGDDLGRQIVAEALDRRGPRRRRPAAVARRVAGDLLQLWGEHGARHGQVLPRESRTGRP